MRCTHGATVGQVDEERLFYLMARGLAKPDAEQLIIAGFFEPVLEQIPSGRSARSSPRRWTGRRGADVERRGAVR